MVQKPALLSMRSVIVYPALTRILNRCQRVTGVQNINMEKDVGSLQNEALKRKERLKALRDKQRHVSTDDLLLLQFCSELIQFFWDLSFVLAHLACG